jgi:YD repeat-containing protein
VIYTYDALGRVLTASYDTNVFVYYTYDANGNRLSQVINVNTLPLCLGTSAQTPPNPITWGAGLWSTFATGC